MRLGINADAPLTITMVGDHLEVHPLQQEGQRLRRYTSKDIARFLAEEKPDLGAARRVRSLLKRRRSRYVCVAEAFLPSRPERPSLSS